MTSIDVSAILQLGKEFEALSDAVLDENVKQGSVIAGAQVQSEARALVPVDTGALRISVENSVMITSESVVTAIGPTQPYGADIEYGRPPGTYVSAASLSGWAKRKGLSPYAVAHSIMEYGTKAQPYMGPALEAKEDSIVSILSQSVVNAFKQVFGTS